MKRFFSIALIFLFTFSLFSVPAAKADCVCYTGADASGDATPLADSEKLTTDEQCKQACISESPTQTVDGKEVPMTDADGNDLTYEDGVAVSEETLADLAQQQQSAQAAASLATRLDAGECTCYCGIKGQGASPQPESYQTAGECKTICDQRGGVFSICALSSGQMPLANGLCWSEADCKASNDGQWDSEQPAECAPLDHYCYPPPHAVELAVSIGETTRVFNIGTYINLIYTYGLGAAGIIAIVMIMIGGAQYILGAGTGGEAVKAATTRITNAVTGLILLFLVYVILYAVNPTLTVFKTIEMPRIKPSLFVQGSCEKYTDKGFVVDPSPGESATCGGDGIISTDPNGISIAQECIYDDCTKDKDSPGGACVKEGDGTYDCKGCVDMDTDAVDKGLIKISDANCSALTPASSASNPEQKYQCKQGLESDTANFGEDVCVFVKVDCSKISVCSDYGNVLIARSGNAGGSAMSSSELNDENYLQTCYDNPCRGQIGEDCVAVDVEELRGEYQNANILQVAAMIEEGFNAAVTRRVDSTYVLTEADYKSGWFGSIIEGTIGTYTLGYSDVGCVPAAAVTDCGSTEWVSYKTCYD